jgi:hypothetical protein
LETWTDSLCFPPGVDTIYIDFTPIQDNLTEGNEWITITLISVNGCGVETPVSVTLWVTDAYDFTFTVPPSLTVQCLTTPASAEVTNITGSLPPYTYQWNLNGNSIPGGTGSSQTLLPGNNPQEVIPYSVTVTDLCGTQVTQNVNLIVNQTLDVNPNSGPTACGLSSGFVQFPVVMRIAPTALEQTGTATDYQVRYTGGNSSNCSSVPAFSDTNPYTATFTFTVASGLTAGQASMNRTANSNAYLAWSAEL